MKNLFDYLAYVAVRLLICILQAMRIETCQRLIRPIVFLAHDVLKIRRSVLEENLQHAFPDMSASEREDLIRRNWEHLLLMVVEIAHSMRKIHETSWRRYVRLSESRMLVKCLLDERPTVIVAGHFGNFEVGGQIVGMFGFPTFTVARPLDNPYLDRLVNNFRTARGQRVLAKQGSAAEVDALLEGGGTLAVLGDQSAGPKGCWVEFFNRPASTHKAIALFAVANDAPLLVNYTRRDGAPLHFEIGLSGFVDPQDDSAVYGGVREMTAWYTERLEEIVRRDPEQYWWIHRRWKDQRPARRRKKLAA